MPRQLGSRNSDYEATRNELLTTLTTHLLADGGEPATLKDLAVAAGVSVPTLKHYFTDRAGVIDAVLGHVRDQSARYHDDMAAAAGDDPEEVIRRVLAGVITVWRKRGFGVVFGSGMALGVGSSTVGPRFVDAIVEPLLGAVERLLRRFVADGALPVIDVRSAALTLVGPVVVALLHQDQLGGRRCRPLDMDSFVRTHVRVVVAGLREERTT